jgi:serine/threonine protein kinase
VLYECLTGHRPFDGPSVLAVLSVLENHEPKPPHELEPVVSREMSELVMRLLENDRERRPESAVEVVETLGRLERPAAVLERPRRRLLVAGLLASLAVLVTRWSDRRCQRGEHQSSGW